MALAMLAILTILALFSAVSVTQRLGYDAPSEKLLAALLVFMSLLYLPIHLLGWAGHLSRSSLAVASAGLSIAALLASSLIARKPAVHLVATSRAAWMLAALPVRAFSESMRQSGIVFCALVAGTFIISWTAILSWLAPSGSWDGLTYHEPIVYYAIQNGGFGIVDVAASSIAQQINSAPRVGHYLMIWLTIFTGRTLVELAPSIMAVYLVVGFYTTARRFTGRMQAMGWAIALLCVPAIALQMRSTLQDMSFAAIFAVCMALVTRPRLRPVDILMACVALGLLGGYKATGLLLVPLMAIATLVRIIPRSGRLGSGLRIAAATAVGVLVIVFWMAPIYVRNWYVYKNPVWPRHFEYEAVGIDFKGQYEPYQRKDAKTVLKSMFSPPRLGKQFHDTRDNGYGNGPPFVVLPLAMVAILAMMWIIARSLVKERRLSAIPPHVWSLLLLTGPVLVTLRLSPSWDWARYTVYAIVTAFALTAWLLGTKRTARLNEALMGAMIVTGLMTLWWSEPGWAVTARQAYELASQSPQSRAANRFAGNFCMQRSVALARSNEIGAGDVVAYSEDRFIGNLWNEAISNEVIHVPWPGSRESYLEKLEEREAVWVQVKKQSREERALVSKPERWKLLGHAVDARHPVLIYSRKQGAAP